MKKRVLSGLLIMLIVWLVFIVATSAQLFPKPLRTFSPPIDLGDLIYKLAFSPDGKLLAVATDLGVFLYKTSDFSLVELIDKPKTVDITFSPDSKLLAALTAGAHVLSKSSTISIYDVVLEQEVAALEGPAVSSGGTGRYSSNIDLLAFRRNGELLISAGHVTRTGRYFSEKGGIEEVHWVYVWDVSDVTLPKKVGEIKTVVERMETKWDYVTSLALSPGSNSAAYGTPWCIIRVFGGFGKTLDAMRHSFMLGASPKVTSFFVPIEYRVISVTFSPSGKWLASTRNDRTIRVWDMEKRKEVAVLKGHTGFVTAFAFSPDGKWLASGSDDDTVRLWDVALQKRIAIFKHSGIMGDVACLAFSPDGNLLVSADRRKLYLWDTKNIKGK